MVNILVTGATKGIGKAIAQELKSVGNVYVTGRNVEALREYKNYCVCDLAEDIDILESFIADKKIDILINNAGISQIKEFTQITDEDWNNLLNTNLNSVFYTSQEACKNMIHNKNGCIINISSIWGQIGASCEVHYSVSKAGIDAMTKSLAKELGPSNIRVNSIAPGIINTEMNNHLSEEELNNLKDEIPLEKIGRTKDIERCVEWLIDDEYTTGQIISINGGWGI